VIYRLDFGNLYEWNNCNSANSKLLEMVHNLVPDSLLLYRYKVNKSIVNRYGVNDPEKIDFDLIKHKSIVVYHLDIYKEKPALISELIKFCLETDRNLFSKLVTGFPPGAIKVAESAVREVEDVVAYRQAGADVVLIGEALVTGDPASRLDEFLNS
jgi:hypothetical protein